MLEPPSGTSVVNWLGSRFGIGSAEGYTTIHPQKTDACDFCCASENDAASIRMTLKRHGQQHDQTLERAAAVAELEATLKDVEAARLAHLEEADEAKEAYKSGYAAASHECYAELTASFAALPRDGAFNADGSINGHSAEGKQMLAFAKRASGFVVPLDTDFQQDKSYPEWKQTPQPGPT